MWPDTPLSRAGLQDDGHPLEPLDTELDTDVHLLLTLAANACGVAVAAAVWGLPPRSPDNTCPTPPGPAVDVSSITSMLAAAGIDPPGTPNSWTRCATTSPGVAGAVPCAVAPLETAEGQVSGALILADATLRHLEAPQEQLLRAVGRMMARRLEQTLLLERQRVPVQPGHVSGVHDTAGAAALAALAILNAGPWQWDLSTGMVTGDARVAQLLQWPQAGAVSAAAAFSGLNDETLERLHTSIADLLAGRPGRFTVDAIVRHPLTSRQHVRLVGVLTGGMPPDGGPRITGVALDIEEERREARETREAGSLDTIGALAAGVAHEINTPLQFVSHNLDYLADRCEAMTRSVTRRPDMEAQSAPGLSETEARALHDDVASAIAESIDGLDRVSQIVRALKALSHTGNGNREPVDINRMVDNAITLTRNEWRLAADMERDLAPGLPPVTAAAYECGQLLVNLIVNASHAVAAAHTDGRKGVISLRTRLVNGQVEIRLGDTGTGIPAEIRDRVFEPFFTTKSVGKGTGQGLATARAIVERHGGTISFDTEVGRGTTFIVCFPVANGSQQAA